MRVNEFIYLYFLSIYSTLSVQSKRVVVKMLMLTMCVVASYLSSYCRMLGWPSLQICQEIVHIGWNAWANFIWFVSFTLSATKRREGIDSGYSSLEKTRADAEDTQTGPDQDHRCERFTHATASHSGLHFPTSQLLRLWSLGSANSGFEGVIRLLGGAEN